VGVLVLGGQLLLLVVREGGGGVGSTSAAVRQQQDQVSSTEVASVGETWLYTSSSKIPMKQLIKMRKQPCDFRAA
jgi:hypothetical protein